MTNHILFLAHPDESGTAFPKSAYESLGAAVALAQQLGAALTIGLIGANIQTLADAIAAASPKILAVIGPEFSQPRSSTDARAAEALARAANADLILAPATSRFLRALPVLAQRLNGRVDTHVSSLHLVDGNLTATRWFYRQRIEGTFQRTEKPWIVLLDSGCHQPWTGTPTANAAVEQISVALSPEHQRTTVSGIRAPKSDTQTIRPDANLLFVAGAGWTKKQSDGRTHPEEAEKLILEFLRTSGASLGGSKSLVDQSGENQTVLAFMTHLNQVGQTGATPRHPKGLSTCCHGEEPHVVGWRFINERRAINLDPNCGWARGKADVLYVANAFAVIAKLNDLLAERARQKEQSAVASD